MPTVCVFQVATYIQQQQQQQQMDSQTRPTFAEVQEIHLQDPGRRNGNLIALWKELDQGTETPTSAFLKVRQGALSFLFELSAEDNPVVLRHSIISTEPWKVVKTGPGFAHNGDPLLHLQSELSKHKVCEHI